MKLREKWRTLVHIPAVRTCLFGLGLVMMATAPLVGFLPGPGGVIWFGFGLGLALKYSEWAKRKYVEFKRRHPRKGAWADWGMRRPSAKRREEIRKQQRQTALQGADD